MAKQKRPQILPTRQLRKVVEAIFRTGDRLPVVGNAMRGYVPRERSDVPVTLVVPLHPKDLWIAPYAVKYALRNVWHPVEETLVVSPEDEGVKEWTEREGLVWVPEGEVLGYAKKDVQEQLPERLHYKAGWVFQQLLKLGLNERLKTEGFLVVDSDTLLLKPKVFLEGGLFRLGYSHERNLLYRKAYEHLLGERCHSWRSYVTHYMFAEKRVVSSLREQIEERSGKSWDQTIIDLATSSIWTEKERALRPFNYFSEYETYANFAFGEYERVKTSYFRSHAAKEYDPRVESVSDYVERLPPFFHWASFHSYYGFQKKLEGLKED